MSERKTTPLTGPDAEREMGRLTRRSFAAGALTAMAATAGWTWLQYTEKEDGIPWPLRRMLRFDETLARGTYSPQRLAPTFSWEDVQLPGRVNGNVGLANELDAAGWRLHVQAPGRDEQRLTLAALSTLPRVEVISEFKCVEGWSRICQFSGVRFADFAAKFGLATHCPYVYMATPDEGYYVGLDMASAMHPQTLLCDTMNGERLTPMHGAPLRLMLTVKYGWKSIKRLGLVRCQDERPRDFWAENRYDWYGGL